MKYQRIAVVNDQPEFLELMREFLEMEGYEILAITKHQGAFEQIKQSKPDMIICDLVFGEEVAGWALLDMLYFDPATRAIPLILCSAAVHKIREAQASLSAKGIRWLEKPFAFEELTAMIHTFEESTEGRVRRDDMTPEAPGLQTNAHSGSDGVEEPEAPADEPQPE
jgi:two-component system phosphate regulon response regulator PhoB/two-component system alkaline phosphatase synthesis response regulator PhoP